ncbi:hypothetical protein BGZ68_006337 [Mortierella alpina]|nr:hypothetical protein BGZ68_006337 [Mortierella alpina]
MRLLSTLTVLSVAALASAKILRNTASNLCLDVETGFYPGAPLVLWPCDNLYSGDWSIEVRGENSAIIKNNAFFQDNKELCVGLFKDRAILVQCRNEAVNFKRIANTNPKRWSFSTMIDDREFALISDTVERGSRLELWPVNELQDDDRRYEWSTSPKKTMYQDQLYAWMRYQV